MTTSAAGFFRLGFRGMAAITHGGFLFHSNTIDPVVKYRVKGMFREKKLGILASGVILTNVMALRTIVGLMMGLAIQLALMQPLLSGSEVSHCAGSTCCEELASCPCANNDDAEKQPSPIAPAPVDSKLGAPRARHLDCSLLWIQPEVLEAEVGTTSIPASHLGFEGVPLSVAFCTFVI